MLIPLGMVLSARTRNAHQVALMGVLFLYQAAQEEQHEDA